MSHWRHPIELALGYFRLESSTFFAFEVASIGPFPFELAVSLMFPNGHPLAGLLSQWLYVFASGFSYDLLSLGTRNGSLSKGIDKSIPHLDRVYQLAPHHQGIHHWACEYLWSLPSHYSSLRPHIAGMSSTHLLHPTDSPENFPWDSPGLGQQNYPWHLNKLSLKSAVCRHSWCYCDFSRPLGRLVIVFTHLLQYLHAPLDKN